MYLRDKIYFLAGIVSIFCILTFQKHEVAQFLFFSFIILTVFTTIKLVNIKEEKTYNIIENPNALGDKLTSQNQFNYLKAILLIIATFNLINFSNTPVLFDFITLIIWMLSMIVVYYNYYISKQPDKLTSLIANEFANIPYNEIRMYVKNGQKITSATPTISKMNNSKRDLLDVLIFKLKKQVKQ